MNQSSKNVNCRTHVRPLPVRVCNSYRLPVLKFGGICHGNGDLMTVNSISITSEDAIFRRYMYGHNYGRFSDDVSRLTRVVCAR